MLEIRDLHVNYGAIAALHGVTLHVPAGKIVIDEIKKYELFENA